MLAAATIAILGMVSVTPVAEDRLSQFDLVCRGTMTASFPITGHPPIVTLLHDRVRVDLKRGLWCWEACKQTYAVRSFDVGQIEFDKDGGSSNPHSGMKYIHASQVLSNQFKLGPGSPIFVRSERCEMVSPSAPIP